MTPVFWTGFIIVGIIGILWFFAQMGAGAAQQGFNLGETGNGHSVDRSQPKSRFSSPVWVCAVLLFLAVLMAKLGPHVKSWVFGTERPAIVDDDPQDPSNDEPTTPMNLEETLTALEANTAAAIQRAELANAKVDQKHCIERADRVLTLVAEWEKEIRDWDDDVLSLLTDSKGQLLAANADLVRQYRAIESQPRSDRQHADHVRQAINTLTESVRLAFADHLNAYRPKDTMLTRLDELTQKATAGRDEYRRARLQVKTLLSTARARGVPGKDTLQLAITAQKSRELREANALLERETEKARMAANATVAQAKADTIRAKGEGAASIERAREKANRLRDEQEAKRIDDEEAAARRKRDDDLQAEIDRKNRELLVRQFEREWPAMKTYLTPFVTPGFAQPTSKDSWKREAEKTPVSFGALQAARMLEPGFESLRKLMYKTSANGWNDRPMGGFPQYRGGDPRKSQELLQRIQNFLNKYGDIMVKKELLTP